MSQLAVFNLVNVSILSELRNQSPSVVVKKLFSKKIINHYWKYLQDNSTLLYGLDSEDLNGGIFLNIIYYLESKKGIDLQDSLYKEASTEITEKQQSSTLILTIKHKAQFNNTINIDEISADECRSANIEFSGDDSDESVDSFIEGLNVLRDVLNKIQDDDSVIVFTIG